MLNCVSQNNNISSVSDTGVSYSAGIVALSYFSSNASNCLSNNNNITSLSYFNSSYSAGVVSETEDKVFIVNCTSSNNKISSSASSTIFSPFAASYSGGICSVNLANSNISNCFSNSNTISSSSNAYTSYSAGISATNEANSIVSQCNSSGNVVSSSSSSSSSYSSGVCATNYQNSNISGCLSANNNVTSSSSSNSSYSSGICSRNNQSSSILSCTSTNNFISSSSFSLLFISYSGGVNCVNQAGSSIHNTTSLSNTISSSLSHASYLGGISSLNENSSVSLCFGSKNIIFSNSNITLLGAISAYNAFNSTIFNCSAYTNSISSFSQTNSSVGGICALNSDNSTVTSCVSNENNVSSANILGSSSGGVIGTLKTSSNVTNCTSHSNNISGYVSGGVVGRISQSNLFDSRFKSNSFSNFNTTGFCVAKQELGSFVSECIDEGCIYQVENCSYCNPNFTVNLNSSQLNVSCVFTSPDWVWNFKNKTSNTIYLNSNLNLTSDSQTQKTAPFTIEGDLVQSPNSTISISLNNANRNDYVLNVTGCVSLNGNLSLLLNERPLNENSVEYQLISYNCTQTISISDSQVDLVTNYNQSNCDTTSKLLNNRPNSLSVSLSTTLNNKCGSKNFHFFDFSLFLHFLKNRKRTL